MMKIFSRTYIFPGLKHVSSIGLKLRGMLALLMMMNVLAAIAVPLTGTKTIGGTNPDFASFTLAVAALNVEGVGPGGVTFLVAAGVYNESFTINSVAGSGPASRVTFLANGGSVTINVVGTSGNDFAVRLNGADYITFDAINIANGGTSAADHCEVGYDLATVGTTDGASNNIIRNCSINITGGTQIPVSSRGIRFSTTTATQSSATSNNNKLQNLVINGAERGISIFGTIAFEASGNEISNCTFGNIRAIGNNASGTSGAGVAILVTYAYDCSVFNNIIDSVVASNTAATGSVYGIHMFRSSGEVFSNQIRYVFQGNTTTNSTAIGIYAGASLNGSLKIHNNFVSGIGNGYTSAVVGNVVSINGLLSLSTITGGGPPVHWYFNTVRLSSPLLKNNSSAAMTITNANGGHQAIVKNNILINEIGNSGTSRSFAIADFNTIPAGGLLVSDYNNLMVTGLNGFIGLNNTTPQIYSTSLSNWQTNNPGLDQNSVSMSPVFMSASNLHLDPAFNAALQNTGTPIPGVLADVDLFIRDFVAPEIGADEICLAPQTSAISIASSVAPVITAGDTVIFTAAATNAGLNPAYQWYVSGTPVGANSNTYTSDQLQNGDVVSCNLISSLTCTSILPIGSNAITITVFPEIPATDSIRNITIGSGQDSCYSATDTIFLAGGNSLFSVQNGGSATMIAGKSIFFFPGTTVNSGGYLLAYIAPSGPFCGGAPVAAPFIANTNEIPLPVVEPEFRIYPNPTTGEFTLEIPDYQSDKTTNVEIHNMQGKKILDESYSFSGKHHLSLAGKSAGIYLLKVVSENKSTVYKIIKQ